MCVSGPSSESSERPVECTTSITHPDPYITKNIRFRRIHTGLGGGITWPPNLCELPDDDTCIIQVDTVVELKFKGTHCCWWTTKQRRVYEDMIASVLGWTPVIRGKEESYPRRKYLPLRKRLRANWQFCGGMERCYVSPLCTYGDIKRAIHMLNEYGNESFTTLSQCRKGVKYISEGTNTSKLIRFVCVHGDDVCIIWPPSSLRNGDTVIPENALVGLEFEVKGEVKGKRRKGWPEHGVYEDIIVSALGWKLTGGPNS